MVVFGFPEFGGRNQLGHDGLSVAAGRLQSGHGLASLAFLFLIVEENHRPVLGADVWTLAVWGSWIVVIPKHFQQSLIGKLGRVIFHQNCFGVTSGIGADLFITRGTLVIPAGITGGGVGDSVQLTEKGFDAPKSASGESCS